MQAHTALTKTKSPAVGVRSTLGVSGYFVCGLSRYSWVYCSTASALYGIGSTAIAVRIPSSTQNVKQEGVE